MLLKLSDRLICMNYLVPKTGDMLTMMVAKPFLKRLQPSQEEVETISKRQEEGKGIWGEDWNPESEIEILESEKKIITDNVSKMSSEKKIHIDWIETIQKVQA
jgi:hypothetical protein